MYLGALMCKQIDPSPLSVKRGKKTTNKYFLFISRFAGAPLLLYARFSGKSALLVYYNPPYDVHPPICSADGGARTLSGVGPRTLLNYE